MKFIFHNLIVTNLSLSSDLLNLNVSIYYGKIPNLF